MGRGHAHDTATSTPASLPASSSLRRRWRSSHCRAIGRDPATIEHTYYGFLDLSEVQNTGTHPGVPHVLYGTPAQVAGELLALIGLGVRHIMLRFLDFPSTVGLDRFTTEVLPLLRAGAAIGDQATSR
ncbi:MAG TPA: hypothetical protein VNL71_23170 [Chloroflexota bacterium]|nr:hypothetical protein [Chloroflexota bacterium]